MGIGIASGRRAARRAHGTGVAGIGAARRSELQAVQAPCLAPRAARRLEAEERAESLKTGSCGLHRILILYVLLCRRGVVCGRGVLNCVHNLLGMHSVLGVSGVLGVRSIISESGILCGSGLLDGRGILVLRDILSVHSILIVHSVLGVSGVFDVRSIISESGILCGSGLLCRRVAAHRDDQVDAAAQGGGLRLGGFCEGPHVWGWVRVGRRVGGAVSGHAVTVSGRQRKRALWFGRVCV